MRLEIIPPEPGTEITSVGYHKMTCEIIESTIEKMGIDYYQKTAFSTGSIVTMHNEYRDRGMLNWPCFQMNVRMDGGMSGGACN